MYDELLSQSNLEYLKEEFEKKGISPTQAADVLEVLVTFLRQSQPATTKPPISLPQVPSSHVAPVPLPGESAHPTVAPTILGNPNASQPVGGGTNQQPFRPLQTPTNNGFLQKLGNPLGWLAKTPSSGANTPPANTVKK